MFKEDELLPISALQHLLYCERQCALIHLERVWVENGFTAEGRLMHDRAHDGPSSRLGSVRVARGLALQSLRLGLTGYADVVEFHPATDPDSGPRLIPIEYKRGRSKTHDADRVQLCAQAMCLEEMLKTRVLTGHIFYGQTRRREEIPFDDTLRRATEETAGRLHALIASGKTPVARREAKCDGCSLLDVCLPGEAGRAAAAYFDRAFERALTDISSAQDE